MAHAARMHGEWSRLILAALIAAAPISPGVRISGVAAASYGNLGASEPAAPATVVGDGTPDSCTQATLHTALLLGGTITFNCGGVPSIEFSTPETITLDTTIQGSGVITFTGNNNTRLFAVDPGVSLTLQRLQLANARALGSDGGVISNLGTLIVEDSLIHFGRVDNDHNGGAIFSAGPLTITGSTLAHNIGGSAGALFANFADARVHIADSVFDRNEAQNLAFGYGGAIRVGTAAQVTIVDSQITHNTGRMGGGIYLSPTAGVTITRSGAGTLLDSNFAGHGGAIFNQDGLLIVEGAVLRNNNVPTNTTEGNGGAIYTVGPLAIRNSHFESNQARFGGAVMVGDPSATPIEITIDRTVFYKNWVFGEGGGVYADNAFSRVTLTDVILEANQAGSGGGMVHHYGQAVLNNVTLVDNEAVTNGGGYFDHDTGSTVMTNVTLSGNSAGGSGGGLHTAQTLTLTNVTVAYNTAAMTAGLHYNGGLFPYTARNVLIAHNTAQGVEVNCSGTGPNFLTTSLSSDATCGFGSGSSANVPLGPLQINGGLGGFLMPTHLPLPGSQAIDGGTTTGCPMSDQRGGARPAGLSCDVGAVESDAAVPWLWLALLRR
jgi:predicted outer membrane repeat protein